MVAPWPGGPATVVVVPRRREPPGKSGASGGGTGRVRPATGVAGRTRSASPAGSSRERGDDGSPAEKANICSYLSRGRVPSARGGKGPGQEAGRAPEAPVGHNAARMCGRFALYTPPARIARYFEATLAEGIDGEHAPSWNVAPTDPVLGVRDRPPPRPGPAEEGRRRQRGEPERMLMSFRWGLIPWWSKDAKSGSRLFNARSETVATRASFREAFRERRIIVPADGFYEWRKTKTGAKQPHYFSRADGAAAGLRRPGRALARQGRGPRTRRYLRSCTVITTPGRRRTWRASTTACRSSSTPPPSTSGSTRPTRTSRRLRALLRPPPAGTVVHHPVGPRIGNVRNNDPTLIESV